MATTIQKWGNSLGVRIPKAIAEQVQFTNGTEIEFSTEGGILTLVPKRRPARRRYKLAELLKNAKGPTPHRRFLNDPPVGRELL